MKVHMETWFTYGGCKVKMPEMGKNTIEFKHYNKQQVAPYIIYADFEALMNEISGEKPYMRFQVSLLLWYHHMKNQKFNTTEEQMQVMFL